MNNLIIKILGLILSLSVIGGVTYYYLQVKETKEEYSLGKIVDKVSGDKVADDFILPANRKCTFENSSESQFGKVTIRSTMYVSGTNISTASEMDSMGKVIKSNVIIKDNTTYMWSSASDKVGAKVTSKTGESLSSSYQKSVEKAYTSCRAWSVDYTVFNLPQGIDFVEVVK